MSALGSSDLDTSPCNGPDRLLGAGCPVVGFVVLALVVRGFLRYDLLWWSCIVLDWATDGDCMLVVA